MSPLSGVFSRCVSALHLVSLFALGVSLASAELVISEFMAVADEAFPDDDGQPSDWIEITNTGGASESLAGYHLTNSAGDLTRWTFPAVSIAASSSIVIFASGKDRSDPGAPLHTSFTLDRGGDFLGLIAPDGSTVVYSFAPAYPEQYDGISYGEGFSTSTQDVEFVPWGAAGRYLIPTDASLGDTWTAEPASFDDSAWLEGVAGFGWETMDGTLEALISTDIRNAMQGENATGYFRFPFNFSSTDRSVMQMQLTVLIDAGFVAYLNGVEVGELFRPEPLAWDSQSNGERGDAIVVANPIVININTTGQIGALVDGDNVLAIHGMNSTRGSSDFLIDVELTASVFDTSGGLQLGFFETPTPGAPNSTVRGVPPGAVLFSAASTLFETEFELSLSVPTTPGALIRYTTDLSVPSNALGAESPEYTGPITIDTSTQVRARAFVPGDLPGVTGTETFLKMAGGVPAFDSDLPVLIMSTLGGGTPPPSDSTTRVQAYMFIFEPDPETGRTTWSSPAEITTRAGVRRRGSSSANWPKYSLSIETWNDDDDDDRNIEPLDFPREADWILSGRYMYDRALMRNPFIYEISRQVGRYAARTRFVEVYNDVNGGALDDSDYFGVYSLIEKLEADPNRIDVARLMTWENAEPEVSGGYVFRKDRNDAGGPPTYSVDGMGALIPTDPGGEDVTAPQTDWIEDFLDGVDAAVSNAPSGDHPVSGLPLGDFLDVDSFIDHHWLNTLAMNVDWGRLSAYFYKDRNDIVNAGPIWDFDRTMGSEDGRDDVPQAWDGSGDASRTWNDFRFSWFGDLLGPTSTPAAAHYIDIRQRHTDRWFELRQGVFSTIHMHALIDSMAAEIEEAQVRNFARWTGVPANGGNFAQPGLSGWESEISQLKGWLSARVEWIDSQYLAGPAFSEPGGVVLDPFSLIITATVGTVWYTTDGSDPRAPGGGIAAGATEYEGTPVAVASTQVITARVVDGGDWSAPTAAAYILSDMAADASKLAIAEIMYRPSSPSLAEDAQGFTDRDDFEYIEVVNIDASDVSLLGVQFDIGIIFDFDVGAITALAPGERVLVVKNRAAFEFRYGTTFADRIAGEFQNDTGLSNGGEQLRISIPAGSGTIRDFTYNDKTPWPEAADGDGFSLVLIAPESDPDHGVAANWRSSVAAGGTPGSTDAVSYAAWAAGFGDPAPGSDGDADGREAFREYGDGTDPGAADTVPGLMEVGSQLIQVGGQVDVYLTLAVRKNLAADELLVTPQSSTDFVAWTDASADLILVEETNHGDGTATLLYRSALPIDQLPAETYFLRTMSSLR